MTHQAATVLRSARPDQNLTPEDCQAVADMLSTPPGVPEPWAAPEDEDEQALFRLIESIGQSVAL